MERPALPDPIAAPSAAPEVAPLASIGSPAPYPGLRPFTRDESDIYFGRDELTDELIRRLGRSRFLGLVGVSGCGKSSLLRAGLIPALETGFLGSAGVRWQVAEMRPGSRPMRRLAEALAAAVVRDDPGNGVDTAAFVEGSLRCGPAGVFDVLREHEFPPAMNLLLVVDQFEEIFRYRSEGNADEADAFVALLLETAVRPGQRVFVVLGMRSDFLGECALFAGLPELLNDSQFLVPRLSREQRREAIVGPAGVFGAGIAPALVTRLLNEMGSDPDQLPLMQHALMRMWERASARRGAPIELTAEDYDAVGGLRGALSRHADEAFKTLAPPQRRLAETLFRSATEHLTNKQDSRRPIRLERAAAVAGVPWQDLVEVVDTFRRPPNTFLTPPASQPLCEDSVIDITHESLIRAWGRLRAWVFDEGLRTEQFRQLSEAARRWAKAGYPTDRLLRGAELAEALRWREHVRPTAAWAALRGTDFELLTRFLDAGRRSKRWRRVRSGCLALGGLALVAGLIYREYDKEQQEQARQANIRLSYDLAQRSMQERQTAGAAVETSVLLAVEALRRHESARSWQALSDGLRLLPRRERSWPAPDVHALAFDGDTPVAIGATGDPTTAAESGLAAWVACPDCEPLAVSPNGRFVALAQGDAIAVEDRRTGRRVVAARRPAGELQVAVSPGGGDLALVSGDLVERIGLSRPRRSSLALRGGTPYLSPDARFVAIMRVEDARAHKLGVYRLDTGRGVFSTNLYPLRVHDVTFSPDGDFFAAAIDDGTMRIWSLTDNFEVSRADLGSTARGAVRLALGPQGAMLAALVSDGVRVFDPRTKVAREVFRIESPGRRSAAFNGDASRLALAGTGGISLWHLSSGNELTRVIAKEPLAAAAVAPDARVVATATAAAAGVSTVTLWRTGGGAHSVGIDAEVRALAFTSDGGTLVAGREDGGLCRIAVPAAEAGSAAQAPAGANGQLATECRSGPGYFGALSADAALLAHGRYDKRIRLIRADDETTLAEWTARPSLVALSRDEHYAANVGVDRQVQVWHLAAREASPAAGAARPAAPAAVIDAGDQVLSLAISSGGKHVAWSTWSGTSSLARLAGDGAHALHTIGLDAPVRDFDFSPDGRYLAYGDQRGTVRVWDVAVARAVAELPGKWPVTDIAFSADGNQLMVASDRTVRLVAWRRDDLIRTACARLSRPFGEADWKRYVGNVAYENPCPQITPRSGSVVLEDARRLLSLGRIDDAVVSYESAAAAGITSEDWLRVCRDGAIWGRPRQVLAACDRAVAGDGKSVSATRGSLTWRGIARALADDSAGGIEDLRRAIALMGGDDQLADARARLEHFVAVLQEGGDPFHPRLAHAFRD